MLKGSEACSRQGCKKHKQVFYSNRFKQNKRGCFIRAEGARLGHPTGRWRCVLANAKERNNEPTLAPTLV